MTCQRVVALSQGTASSGWFTNHLARILPVSWVDDPEGFRASRLPCTARPNSSPRNGGTALPICRNAADGGPENLYLSGNVCSRAASRTVRVRSCQWMDIPVAVLRDVRGDRT